MSISGGLSPSTKDDFPQVTIKDLLSLPAVLPNKAMHDRMVQLVDQILGLYKKLSAANTDHEKTALQRQIDATDAEIDRLVYHLYGLTEDEIKIVESSTTAGNK